MDSDTDKPVEPITHNDEDALTQSYHAHIQTGEPPIQSVLEYSNGSKEHLRKLMALLRSNDLSPTIERTDNATKPTPRSQRKRELQAQALLRLRLWIDYKEIFTKQYKKKYGKKKKRKQLPGNELVLRDISRLFSLVAFQLSPQEPFDAYLQTTLDEISGESLQKQKIYEAFEISPRGVQRDEGSSEHPKSSSGKSSCDDTQKPKAKRKRPKSSSHSDHPKCNEASKGDKMAQPPSTSIRTPARMEITAPIRRNSLTQKSRFVGSHFNSGNIDSLFRHVKSSIPTTRRIEIQTKLGTETVPAKKPIRTLVSDANVQPLERNTKCTKEEEAKGIFQTNDKPARRRSSLVADALRALQRRDKK